MGDVMEATVHLPGGWQKGTLREVDPDEAQIRDWIAAGWVVRPKGGQRSARKTLAEDAPEEGSVARQGIDDQPAGSTEPAEADTPPADEAAKPRSRAARARGGGGDTG
jgi:hypothetical protein